MMNTAHQIDRVDEQFREDLDNGGHPNLAEVIASVAVEARAELLIRLLRVHHAKFRGTSHALTLQTAIECFPGFESDVTDFFASNVEAAPGRHVADGVVDSLDTVPTDTMMWQPDLKCPELIAGRYRIEEKVGEGTHGVVYRAFDETLQRRVALKLSRVMQSESTAAEFNSFLEESRILSALEHPRILPVLDAGVTDNGRQFFVSKYLSGGSLADRVSVHGVLPIAVALKIIQNVADALQHAHEQGLYHRDVKLANIIFDDVGNPFLADFGLALRDAERRERASIMAGSPAFMAPEQVRASEVCIDGRTDIWALGIVLYFLLTGRYPFPGGSIEAVFREILERQPQPPRQINPKVSRELEQLTLRCLEKDIEKRVSSAAELSEELDLILRQNAVDKENVQPPNHHTKSQKFLNGRSSILLAGIGTLGIVVLSALALRQAVFNGNPMADIPSVVYPNESAPEAFAASSQFEVPNQTNNESLRDRSVVAEMERERSPAASLNAVGEQLADRNGVKSAKISETESRDSAKPTNQDAEAVLSISRTKEATPKELITRHEVLQGRDVSSVAKELSLSGETFSDLGKTSLSPALPVDSASVQVGDDPTIPADEEESGLTRLIDEYFSAIPAGTIPSGWSAPLNRFRVATHNGTQCLMMPGEGIGKIRLPKRDLSSGFVVELDFEIQGGYFSSPEIQVDLLGVGLPMISVGARINAGRLMN